MKSSYKEKREVFCLSDCEAWDWVRPELGTWNLCLCAGAKTPGSSSVAFSSALAVSFMGSGAHGTQTDAQMGYSIAGSGLNMDLLGPNTRSCAHPLILLFHALSDVPSYSDGTVVLLPQCSPR